MTNFYKQMKIDQQKAKCVDNANRDVFSNEDKWLITDLKEISDKLNIESNYNNWQGKLVDLFAKINQSENLPKLNLVYVNEDYCEIETIHDMYEAGSLELGDDGEDDPAESEVAKELQEQVDAVKEDIDFYIDSINLKFGTLF